MKLPTIIGHRLTVSVLVLWSILYVPSTFGFAPKATPKPVKSEQISLPPPPPTGNLDDLLRRMSDEKTTPPTKEQKR